MKTALIIGGSGGIGFETARVLNSKGIKVCICDKNNLEKTREALGEEFEFYRLDIEDKNSVDQTLSSIINKHSKVDSVIYSVSTAVNNKNIENLVWDEFQKHIDVQIKGLFYIINFLSKINNEKKIKFIVVLTEFCIGKPPSRISPYVTAKYGLMGFVKSMASELNPKKYTFNMVSPGMVNTQLLSNLPPKLIEITADKNPMKRIAESTDIANVISFLVSDEADYLNGVNIPVNGGNIFL